MNNFEYCLHAKTQLHPSLLSWDITHKIPPSDWSKVFRPIYREPEFCQIWGLWRNISNNMIFHFRLFQGKTLIFFLAHFCPFLANQNYSEKSVFDQFFPILGRYYCAKLIDGFWGKLVTDTRTNWLTNMNLQDPSGKCRIQNELHLSRVN